MRERLRLYTADNEGTRITPAYAGKTIFICTFYNPSQDHPRVCGKDSASFLNLSRFLGSPPRMRERPDKRFDQVADPRITPAYAGKTSARNI